MGLYGEPSTNTQELLGQYARAQSLQSVLSDASTSRSSSLEPLAGALQSYTTHVNGLYHAHRQPRPSGLPAAVHSSSRLRGTAATTQVSSSGYSTGYTTPLSSSRHHQTAAALPGGSGSQQQWSMPAGLSRLDVTPLGLSQAASPWPEVPLSPKTPPAPNVAAEWHALDMRASRSASIPEDERSSALSEDGGGGNTASFKAPVLPKSKGSLYVDSAARDPSEDPEDAPMSSWALCCCCCPGAKSGPVRCAAAAWHVLTLAFAEHPVRAHREWHGAVLPRTHSEAAIGHRISSSGADARSSTGGGGMGGCYDSSAGAKRRLPFACISPGPPEPGAKQGLEEYYANDRKRRRLVYALRRRQSDRAFTSAWDRLSNEAFIAGQLCFDWATPGRMSDHLPWATALFVTLIFITFAFMAGEYTAYLGAHTDVGAASGCSAADFAGGPVALARWVAEWGACHTFQPAFLTLWGAKYAPLMRPAGSWWRWLSALLVQDSFAHLAANALLLGGLGLHLERRYGSARIFALALLAGVAGNFFDSLVMDMCAVVLAGAGCAFGLLPLFLADIALNFEAIRYPILRIVGVAALLAAWAAAAFLTGYPSRLTPVGGFLAGILPGALLLPHLKSEKFEWFQPYCAATSSFLFLVVAPVIVYAGRFPAMACP